MPLTQSYVKTRLSSKASWSSTPSFLRPLHNLAARFLPFASQSPHYVLLSAFDGQSGGIEGYLAKRLVLSGSKVSLIDVPTGRTRRRVEPIDAALRRVLRDGESAENVVLAQENFSVLEPDPSDSLDRHLATFFAAWPPVTGVVLFVSDSNRTNSTSDLISHALARSVTSRSSPWVIELDFSEPGGHAEAEEAQVSGAAFRGSPSAKLTGPRASQGVVARRSGHAPQSSSPSPFDEAPAADSPLR